MDRTPDSGGRCPRSQEWRLERPVHPQTVDAVFRKVLRQPHFTWADRGEALLRRRKPWYYEREPRPNRTVIGARLSELIS